MRTLGVGDYVARHGRISEEKLAEVAATLTAFRDACGREQARPILAVGTAAFRDAPNGARAVEIAAALGISMEIASEQRESELAYLAGSLGRDNHAVIDNGSRSVELVAKSGGALRHQVFNLGYRIAYEKFFGAATDPAAAVQAFRAELLRQASTASFMKGRASLVGVEFGEMAAGLLQPAPLEGRVLTLAQLTQELGEITRLPAGEFLALKKTKDVDRALPRLVVAATLIEAFGYSQLVLTGRELGAGLIVEAGLGGRESPRRYSLYPLSKFGTVIVPAR